MKPSIKKGFGFGLTSGVITTLGLIVGLNSGTHSKIVILSGILVIAVADAMSDALGMHISEEAENKHTTKEIWESTTTTFLAKFIFAITFIIPVLFFNLSLAILICIIWGLSLIIIFSYNISKQKNLKACKAVLEHLIIAAIVIAVTYLIGNWANALN